MKQPLHIVNGAVVASALAETDVAGDIVEFADAYDVGPVGAPFADILPKRASWYSQVGVPCTTEQLAAMDQRVMTAAATASEITLWYEHDLFDQLALCRLVAELTERGVAVPLSMVSIDAHPDVPRFLGLGQLASHQLAALWPARIPIGRDMIEEATAAWVSVTHPDPRGVVFAARRTKAMPFLAAALERYLEEFPDVASGLGRMERQVLGAYARGGASDAALLDELHGSDPRYLATDVVIKVVRRGLVTSGLLTEAMPPTVTDLGRSVLAGQAERITAAGIDVWRGGVHLVGRGPVWRWDGRGRRLGMR